MESVKPGYGRNNCLARLRRLYTARMSLQLTLHLPAELETRLRADDVDLVATAEEAFLVELYRRQKLTHHQLATALGLDRFSVERLLQRYGVTEDLGTWADYELDVELLQSLERRGGQ